MIRKIIKFFCVILCMLSIFMFSSDNAETSSYKSKTIIVKMTESIIRKDLTKKEEDYYVKKLVKIVRKSAHFTLYFLLGLSIISLSVEYLPLCKKNIIIAALIVFLYACSDEIHQLFIPGRSGEILDVIIDTCGGMTAITIYSIINKLRRKKNG